jgi:hypothetical protein
LAYIEEAKPGHLILCARWSRYLSGESFTDDGFDFLVAGLGNTARTPEVATAALKAGLRSLGEQCRLAGTHIWVLLEPPAQPMPGAHRVFRSRLYGKPLNLWGVSLEEHVAFTHSVLGVLEALPLENVTFVDLAQPFFGEGGVSRVGDANGAWYWDDDHISEYGAIRVLGPMLCAMLDKISASCPE